MSELGKRRRAAGNIDAHPVDGAHQLPQGAFVVVVDPTQGWLAAVKRLDPRHAQAHCVHDRGCDIGIGGLDGCCCHHQGRRRHAVEAHRPLDNRRIAALPHIGQNPPHRLVRAEALAEQGLDPIQQGGGHREFIPRLASEDRGLGRCNVIDLRIIMRQSA